jgi:histidinol-phosphatase
MAFEKELALAHRWVDGTDALALEHFKLGTLTQIKEDGTPVTAGDRAVERALRRDLEEHFPDDAVLGEEEGAQGEGPRRWIIDPIDGTKNYARGIPVFATLIALEVDGEPVLGLVSAPALGSRWWAVRGEGAFHSGRSIRVSQISTLADADLITGGDDWAQGNTEAYAGLLERARRQRGFGDFWGHMLVAQGSAEAMIEFAPLARWDIIAPRVIVEEAGGRCTALDGGPAEGGPTLSTNGMLHDELRAALA